MGKNVIISTLPNISQNYLPKVNTSNIFANSLVYDDGSSVLINTTTASAFRLDVNGTGRFQGALSGTSATFSGLITANANITAAGLIYGRTTNNFPTTGLGYYAIKTNNFDAERGGITIQVSSATNTLTDALTINYLGAATFSGIVGVNGASEAGWALKSNGNLKVESSSGTTVLQVNDTSTGGKTWSLISAGAGNTHSIPAGTFYLRNSTDGTTAFQISSTGAATFSSSVTATGGLISNGGSIGYGGGELGFNVTTSGATSGIYTTATGSPILYFDHRATGNTGFWVWRSGTGGGTTALTLSNTGAATFSSSVTATKGFFSSNGASDSTTGLLANASTNDNTTYAAIFGSLNAGYRMVVRADGNVGIGTTSPSELLHVYKSSTFATLLVENGTSNSYALYQARTANSGTWQWGCWNNNTYRVGLSGVADYMTITSGGNVGIGTTDTQTFRLAVDGPNVSQGDTTTTIRVFDTTSATTGTGGGISFAGYFSGTSSIINTLSYIKGGKENSTAGDYASYLSFGTRVNGGSPTERMRITSGGAVLVGTTSTTGVATGSSANPGVNIGPGASSFQVNNNSNIYLSKASGYTSNDFTAHFVNGTYVGGISTNGSSTTYATSSDYRLKTDLKDFVGIDIVKLLNVYDYQWVLNKSRSFGVLAHELQSVLPDAVTGVKDGEQMQGVDYSKLTPILVKAIQEQQAQIEEQKADIESLKALINK